MSKNKEVQNNQLQLGNDVFVKGTGKWWNGIYKAQIVDIREADNTIKIRYQDGGFKRFERKNLLENIVKENDPALFEFGSKAYELNFDDYDPKLFVDTLESQLTDAVQKKDFKQAQQIQNQIDQKRNTIQEINKLNLQIQQAVYLKEFTKADQLQQKAQNLEKVLKDKESKDANNVNWNELFSKSFKRALGGGIAGASAMAIQVITLMWMRTTMNYQYRYGTSTKEAFKALYAQGGIPRFYKGLVPALLQGPLSRFGDTFANTGVMTFMNSHKKLQELPVSIKTVCSSAFAAVFRIFLMPIDTVKTIMQVEGKDGFAKLMTKTRQNGPQVFFHGSIGASVATFAGHYPWFFTYNTLDSKLPRPNDLFQKLARSAFIGFFSSAVSDTVSNSIRVLKTYKQTTTEKLSYMEIAQRVVKEDGFVGLFGRGLQTRIIANGLQGLLFSVLWKYFDEKISKSKKQGT